VVFLRLKCWCFPKLDGNHHSGIDDVKNISSIVEKMIEDGAIFDITGKRDVKIVYKAPQYQPKKREGQLKTNIKYCKFFKQGNCKKGNDCQFSHSNQEDAKKEK